MIASAARSRTHSARRWVITTAAPSAKVAARWGDWHLAEGLAHALRRLGEDGRRPTARSRRFTRRSVG